MSHNSRYARKICANAQIVHASPVVAYVGNMALDARAATRLINAAGWDAGNASMRKAGRSVWSRADYNAAARKANQLFKSIGLAP